MSVERAWRFRLEHIVAAIDKIFRYTEGLTPDAFRNDDRTVDAVIRNLEIIGEATRHIPQGVRSANPAIPWSLMERMRHVLAHDYEAVKAEIVWRTVCDDLRPVRLAIQDLLDREQP
jgi:uncharacterized protein with HEPN domain